MKKRVISILLSAAMISSMVVAGGVTAHAEENVTLNVFDAHAYGLEEYDEMVKAFEKSHPGVTVDMIMLTTGAMIQKFWTSSMRTL